MHFLVFDTFSIFNDLLMSFAYFETPTCLKYLLANHQEKKLNNLQVIFIEGRDAYFYYASLKNVFRTLI